MAKLASVIVLQLLLGTFRPSLLQRTSAGLRSVHPGDNITLHCDVTAEYEVSWYHQSSEEMKLLVSVGRTNRDKHYYVSHIANEDHYEVAGNTGLVIVGVNETDLGLYYCGGRNHTSFLRFGKAIRLNFAEGEGDEGREEGSEDTTQSPVIGSLDSESHQILTVALMSVCLVSVLMNIVFSWVICYMVQGRPTYCWRNTNSLPPAQQELEVQYASPVYNRDVRKAPEENTAAAADSVTYARISPPGCLSPA